ncbi:MAG: hypothetical protein OXD35_03700 [Thiotrichales bacterium]|nr:hypothetical protein [Thiotrichales bacterium]
MKHSTPGSSGLFARRLRIGGNRMTTDRTLFGAERTVLAALAVSVGTALGGVSQAMAWSFSNDGFQMDYHVQVFEGEPAVFTVRVPEKLTFAVRWRYETEDATATAGSDYTASQGTIQFDVGEREKRITVQTLTDDTVEVFPEIFQLQLTDMETSTDGVEWEPGRYMPGLPDYAAATGTIRDPSVPLDFHNPPDEPEEAPTDDPQPDSETDNGDGVSGGGSLSN